jgi:hypothetical protein
MSFPKSYSQLMSPSIGVQGNMAKSAVFGMENLEEAVGHEL